MRGESSSGTSKAPGPSDWKITRNASDQFPESTDRTCVGSGGIAKPRTTMSLFTSHGSAAGYCLSGSCDDRDRAYDASTPHEIRAEQLFNHVMFDSGWPTFAARGLLPTRIFLPSCSKLSDLARRPSAAWLASQNRRLCDVLAAWTKRPCVSGYGLPNSPLRRVSEVSAPVLGRLYSVPQWVLPRSHLCRLPGGIHLVLFVRAIAGAQPVEVGGGQNL